MLRIGFLVIVMLLDDVLSRPDVMWYATEDGKIDLFVTRFGVPPGAAGKRPRNQ